MIIEQFSLNAFILNWTDMHAAHLNLNNNNNRIWKEKGIEITFSLCATITILRYSCQCNAIQFVFESFQNSCHIHNSCIPFNQLLFFLPPKIGIRQTSVATKKEENINITKYSIGMHTRSLCFSQFVAGAAHLYRRTNG